MPVGERRLAAIMFTDIAGFTALAQKDETLALRLLETHRGLLRPVFAKHRGREIKTMGDAFLVEFKSALEATNGAVEMQKVLREHNLNAPEKLMVKVGIHIGDVIEHKQDVLGDAVNIASRIEPLAEGGEICVSEQVYYQIKNKFGFPMVSIGKKELKNVDGEVEVYRVVLPWEGGLVTETRLDKNRVAVLPFASLSPDPNDEFFADGLTDELIDRLSQVRELEVIARTSVMTFKKKEKKAGDIGRELRAGALVEGSVRKAGNRVRVTAQLINSNTEAHLWSSSYDRNLEDIFAVQSDIAQQVTEALKIKLLSTEKKDIEKKPTESTEAYTLFLKGGYFWNERTRVAVDKAVKYFEQAIKLDPTFAQAYAGLAGCYVVYANRGWRIPREAYPLAKEFSIKAIEIDPGLAEPHASLGIVYGGYEHRWHEAEVELKRAVELKASYATAYHWYSLDLCFMGRFDESYEQIKRASELDPLSRAISHNVGEVLLAMGKSKEAIEHFARVIEAYPDWALPHVQLGWGLYLESRIDEAIAELRTSLILSANDPFYKANLACLLGFVGMRAESDAMIEELKDLSKATYVDKVVIAIALVGAGRTDEAFGYLEKGYEDRSDTILYVGFWAWFKELRKDPRWRTLAKRLGLPGA